MSPVFNGCFLGDPALAGSASVFALIDEQEQILNLVSHSDLKSFLFKSFSQILNLKSPFFSNPNPSSQVSNEISNEISNLL